MKPAHVKVYIVACAAAITLLGCGETATPTPTARPTATPDRQGWDDYATAVDRHLGALTIDLSGMNRYCDAKDRTLCRLGMNAVATDADRLLHELDTRPAPACLRSADVELRAALTLIRDGARMGLAGLDSGDASMTTDGAGKIADGSTPLDRATALTKAASC